MRTGKYLLGAGLVVLLVLAFAPSPYVIRQPGPAFDALGRTEVQTENGEVEERDVISIDGAQTYETDDGSLAVMTVNITGTPEFQPSWFNAAAAWLSSDKDVLPIEIYYPDGVTSEQRSEETAAMMTHSQGNAIAAALNELDYDVGQRLVVADVQSEGPAADVLEPGDVIVGIDGRPVTNYASLRAEPFEATATEVRVLRDGEERLLAVTPAPSAESDGEPVLGIVVQEEFDFPVEVTIELDDVGGPSAGLIFTLATMDLLEAGDLTGGQNIAGTGTIDPDGVVGPIGGIRQKMHAADEIGADYFLAPDANCAEALSAGTDVPVYAVGTLDDALAVLDAHANGNETVADLRTCADALSANAPQA